MIETSLTPQEGGQAVDPERASVEAAALALTGKAPGSTATPVVVDFPFCPHMSASGVDATPLEVPWKIWECDGCGWRYRNVLEDGITFMVGVA